MQVQGLFSSSAAPSYTFNDNYYDITMQLSLSNRIPGRTASYATTTRVVRVSANAYKYNHIVNVLL